MRQLTDDEIIDVLRTNGVGVLSLTDPDGGSPYSPPVAYGYDDDQDLLAVQLEGGAESHKKRCLRHDPAVTLTVYEETEPRERWRSVIVRGELVEAEYGAVESALAVLAQNAQFAPNPVVWSDAEDVTPYHLGISSWSGREFDLD